MEIKVINVPLFDIRVKLIQLDFGDTYEDLFKVIKTYELDEQLVADFKDNLSRKAKNGAITCSRLSTHDIFIVFYPFTNEDKMTEVYLHEKRHVEDKILAFCLVDDRETAAYLAGNIGVKFIKFQKNVIQKFKSNPKFRHN